MTAGPLISVNLPTYNRERYLPEAVDSVFRQTYEHWELIVIDDGSTDGTRAFLEQLGDPRVRIIWHEHIGNIARLRNIGVRAARGEYIALMDSDDLWLPQKLALQIADLERHPECGWSYTGRLQIDEHGREIEALNRRPWTPHRGWILEQLIDVRARFPNAAMLIARPLLDAIGGFDERFLRCEDWDLRIRLAEASPVSVVPEPLVKVRRHAETRGTSPLDVLGYMNRIYGGVLRRASSRRVRSLCRRQRIRVNVEVIGMCRGMGRHADALRALRSSFSYAWWHPDWWGALVKTLIRSVLPPRVLHWYARVRHRSAAADPTAHSAAGVSS